MDNMNTPRKEVSNQTINTAGLSKFFASIYSYMAVGLTITGITAFYASQSAFILNLVFGTRFGFLGFFIAEIALVMKLSANGAKLKSAGASIVGFIAFALINGITLSSIFLMYDLGSIGAAFISTAASFAGMSIVGFTTKKDLTSLGGQLRGALIGLIIAMLVNGFFLQSGPADMVLSFITVVIFIGFTAYDTQKLKELYVHYSGEQNLGALAISGALSLYLDFINIFLGLLRIFGGGRD